jgi:hypothetical protein
MTNAHANSTVSDAVTDFRGAVMFHCGVCGAALTKDDFFDMSLRLPDAGESKDAYCEDELIDRMSHTACLRAARAG